MLKETIILGILSLLDNCISNNWDFSLIRTGVSQLPKIINKNSKEALNGI